MWNIENKINFRCFSFHACSPAMESLRQKLFLFIQKFLNISLMRTCTISSWTFVNFSPPLHPFSTNPTDLLAVAWRVTHVLKVASPHFLRRCLVFMLQGAMNNCYSLPFMSLASGIVPGNGDLCSWRDYFFRSQFFYI